MKHALEKIGFQTDQFEFGLDPFAIQPINELEILNPGDSGYKVRSAANSHKKPVIFYISSFFNFIPQIKIF